MALGQVSLTGRLFSSRCNRAPSDALVVVFPVRLLLQSDPSLRTSITSRKRSRFFRFVSFPVLGPVSAKLQMHRVLFDTARNLVPRAARHNAKYTGGRRSSHMTAQAREQMERDVCLSLGLLFFSWLTDDRVCQAERASNVTHDRVGGEGRLTCVDGEET